MYAEFLILTSSQIYFIILIQVVYLKVQIHGCCFLAIQILVPFGDLILSLSLVNRSMKSRILATYPDAFPDDSTGEVVDRRLDLEIPQ